MVAASDPVAGAIDERTVMAAPRRTQYMPLDELVPAKRNAKGHSIPEIRASLERFGVIDAAVMDERTGRLVHGHGRTEALAEAHAAGIEPPEGVTVRGQRWLVPVQRGWSSKNDDEAHAAGVTLNHLTELGGWNSADLALELERFRTKSPDLLAVTGYTSDDVDRLLAETAPAAEPEAPPPIPAVPLEPVTRRGDVWLLGPHRLLCGDCRQPDDVETLMAGTLANVALTSPPYADRRKYDETTEFKPVPPDEYVDWFEPVAENVGACLADDGSWFVNIRAGADDGQRDLYVYDLVAAHVRRWDWLFVDDLCWVDTKNGVPGAWPNRFKDAWEPVFHFARTVAIKFHPYANGTASDDVFDYAPNMATAGTGSGLLADRGASRGDGAAARPSNVIHLSSSSFDGHPAAFPPDLPAWFIRAYSDVGDVVLDPFMGGGSTLLAAHAEHRTAYGLELSPGYCDVICRRFHAVTGVVATHATTGEPFPLEIDQ